MLLGLAVLILVSAPAAESVIVSPLEKLSGLARGVQKSRLNIYHKGDTKTNGRILHQLQFQETKPIYRPLDITGGYPPDP